MKWLTEWILLPFFSVGTALSLWTVWPELSDRLAEAPSDGLTLEGVAALTLLVVVSVGFLKLVFRGEKRHAPA